MGTQVSAPTSIERTRLPSGRPLNHETASPVRIQSGLRRGYSPSNLSKTGSTQVEMNHLEQGFRVQAQGMDQARKNLMLELKAQVVECQSELEQMRGDKAQIVEDQVRRRAEYKGKVADERKRIAFLTKEINSMETEMVNTAG